MKSTKNEPTQAALKRATEQSDEELMQAYQQGEAVAFEVLYERHSAKIYAYIKKRIFSEVRVAEVYQEVFMKLHKSKTLYDKNLPALGWIFTVTRSVLLDELRKDRRHPKFESDESLDMLMQVDKADDERAQNLEALAELPDVQRSAIEMRYLNEESYEKIAEILKVSPTNARQLISRGLRRLREIFEQKGEL